MKSIVITKYVQMFIICVVTFSSFSLNAQDTCFPREEEIETEDLDMELNVEGEDISLDSADVLGSEAEDLAEDIGVSIGEEVGAEIASEAVLSLAADALGPVGILIDIIMFGVMVEQVVDAHKNPTQKNKSVVLRSLPYVPQLPFHANDLESETNRFSSIFYINRRVDENVLKNTYFPALNYTSYIGGEIDISKISNNLKYAFSKYTKDEQVVYERLISPVNFNEVGGNLYANVDIKWREKTLNPECITTSKFPAINEQVRIVMLAKKASGDGYEVKNEIPFKYKLLKNRVKISVNNVDLSKYSLKDDVFLSLQVHGRAYEEIDYWDDSKKKFPLDIEAGHRLYSGSDPFFIAQNMKWHTVFISKVIDFRKLDKTLPIPNIVASTKILPNRYGKVFTRPNYGSGYLNVDFPLPSSDLGSDHLVKQLEIEMVRGGERRKLDIVANYNVDNAMPSDAYFDIHFQTNISDNQQSPELFRVRDYYNSKSLVYVDVDHEADINDSMSNIPLFVRGVNLKVGDMVDCKIYYNDNTVSKQVLIFSDINPMPRDYYRIKPSNYAGTSYLTSNNEEIQVSEAQLGDQGSWLMENQGHSAYAIMNKDSRQVLGIVNGALGLYDWEENNPGLLWFIDFANKQFGRFINLEYQMILRHDASSVDFTQYFENISDNKFLFQFEKESDAEPIFSTSPAKLINKMDTSELFNKGGNVALSVPYTDDGTPTTSFIYHGCGRYSIKNNDNNYLYYDGNQLIWHDAMSKVWTLDNMIEGDYFTLSNDVGILTRNITQGNGNSVTVTQGVTNPNQNNQYYFKVDNDIERDTMLLHYAFDNNAHDSSIYQHDAISSTILYEQDSDRDAVGKFTGSGLVNTGVAFSPVNYKGDFSASLWVNLDSDNDNDDSVLLHGGNWSLTRDNTTNDISFTTSHISGNSTVKKDLSVEKIGDDQWYHIVLTLEKNKDTGTFTKKIYINGIMKAEKSESLEMSTTTQTMMIGGYPLATYIGFIDDVKIYSETLVLDSIVELYKDLNFDIPRGYYAIVNRASQLAISISSDKIKQLAYNDNDDSEYDEWLVNPVAKSNPYTFQNKENDKFLVSNGTVSAKVLSQASSKNFELLPVKDEAYYPNYESYYQIKNKTTGRCLDVQDNSRFQNALIQEVDCRDLDSPFVTAQLFKFDFKGGTPALPTSGNEKMINFSVYPNPSTGNFTVSYDIGQTAQDVTYRIVNASTGGVVKTGTINGAGSKTVNIQLQNASIGVYTIELSAGDVKVSERLSITQ